MEEQQGQGERAGAGARAPEELAAGLRHEGSAATSGTAAPGKAGAKPQDDADGQAGPAQAGANAPGAAERQRNTRVAVVTGGSSGIGRGCAVALAQAGCAVYELSRHDAAVPGVRHLGADITDEAQVNAAISQVLAEQNHIDILVNNAGFGISGAVEMTASEESHRQVEVNVFGADNVTRAVVPHMRERGAGRIVFISSIAGIAPIPFQAWYSVSKAAVLTYGLALYDEVRPYGVSVCVIMPGDIHTGFTAARRKNLAGDDIYDGRISKSVADMEHDEQTGMDPDKAGAIVARYALKIHSRPLVAMSPLYKLFSYLIKFLPRQTVTWLIYLIYGK